MGLSTSLIPAHDDALHSGNAKRAVASGIASLDAASKVVQEPATKGLASGIASLDASSKVVQEPATKGLASGIAPLDAGSKVAVANLPVNAANGIAGLDASSRVAAAQLALAELLANKNAASGYAGLDASILLSLAQQRLNFKIGNFSKNTADASGNQAITGVGFVPRLVVFKAATLAGAGQMSFGFSDGTSNYSIFDNYQSIANSYSYDGANCIDLTQGAGITSVATIASLDADGFTLAWVKAGAKTGTAYIIYLAIR